jgi:N-methylhydantoinase A
VAKKLGLTTLIAPRAAGVASALGLLIAPARVDRVATVAHEVAHLDWPQLEALCQRLEAEARQILEETRLPSADARIERMADIRYVGQASELVVPLPSGPLSATSEAAIREAFQRSYVAAFARTPPATPLEIINVRVTATLDVPGSAAALQPPADAAGHPIKGTRPAYFPEHGTHIPTTIYDRYRLEPGQSFEGPAIIEERESTLIVGPRGRFKVAATGNIIVTVA